MKHVPYRIRIELACDDKGKTLEITGQTPLFGTPEQFSPEDLLTMGANAMEWEANRMKRAGTDAAMHARIERAMALPVNRVPF